MKKNTFDFFSSGMKNVHVVDFGIRTGKRLKS